MIRAFAGVLRLDFTPNGMRPAGQALRGMVTAPHALGAQCGLSILRDGGNAADAIVGVAASLSVLYPHMTGIGGDAFFLYYDARSGQVHSYNGSGAAARAATLQYYRERGLQTIPERGGGAVLTVPGAVDAWFALHERFGSVDFERLLAPAIAYACEGAPAARSFVGARERLRSVLAADEGARNLFVEHGPSRVGERFTNERLGATLSSIAKLGRSWLYEGEGALIIDRHCRCVGSPLRAEDLAAHRGFFAHPAAGLFYGFDSVTTPPNSQGIAALIAQQTYEAYAARPAGAPLGDLGAARTHAGVEAIRLAFADRDAHVTDPRENQPWEQLLSVHHAMELAERIDPNAAQPSTRSTSFDRSAASRRPNEFDRSTELRTVDGGDTAYFACIDAAGNAVSFIQSLFHAFGSAVVVPELGIPLQNRGMSFELSEGRLRSLVPGKRPFHTLMPCMLLRNGKPWLVYGSMGGEGQPQTALQVSTRIACDGMDPQAAIEAPRWRWGKDAADDVQRVHVEARAGASCIAGLRARGHDVNLLANWDESVGHAGAIVIDNTQGLFVGGADPRSDGAAVGW